MFLARTTHNQIVALYEARLEEHRRRYEDLLAERDWYRQAWLERLGLKFPIPIPKPAEVTAVNPSAPITVPDELTQRKTFKLDRWDWSVDDVGFYEDYHVTPMLKEGAPAEELEYWYFQKYGNQRPMTVFIDRPFSIS